MNSNGDSLIQTLNENYTLIIGYSIVWIILMIILISIIDYYRFQNVKFYRKNVILKENFKFILNNEDEPIFSVNKNGNLFMNK